MEFPTACPEIPVKDLAPALKYYRDVLGFRIDWSADEVGLAGLSRGGTRFFLAGADYRKPMRNRGPVLQWLIMHGREAVDALHAEWAGKDALLDGPPEDKPYNLYEFIVRDPDGNMLRVFHDIAFESTGGLPGSQ